MGTPLEISLENRSCARLFLRGANPIKWGMDGLPDRFVLWGGGRHFWIEFKKAETGRLRPMQIQWRKYLKSIGDEVYVVDDFEQVVGIIEWWETMYGAATARRPG